MAGFRWGFNVNGNRVGDVNYFLQFTERISPNWMLIMSNTQLAERVLEVTNGQTQVIDRAYSPKEGTQWQTQSPASYAAELMAGNRKHLWHYILNEPNTGNDINAVRKRNDWLADVVEIMVGQGFKVIVGNLAAGSFENWHIDQGAYDRLLKVLSDNRESAKFGIHEYTAIVLPLGGGRWSQWDLLEREKMQPQYWPRLDHPNPDFRMQDYTTKFVGNYYHLFRSHWLQMRVINTLGLPPVEFVHTEYGWDRMPDMAQGQNHIYDAVKKRYGVSEPFNDLRGAYTHGKVWKYYWPNWSTSQAILEQFKWSDENYNEWYSGFLPFMWSFGDNWDNIDGFNFGADRELHEMMIDWSDAVKNEQDVEPAPPPVPVPPTDPVPDPPTEPTPDPVPDDPDYPIFEDNSNVLVNPSLGGHTIQEIVYDANGNQKIIEIPDDWTWVYEPLESDKGLVPSVFHRSPGMGVSGGYISWRGGFEQSSTLIVKGQRYMARGTIQNNFRFTDGSNDYYNNVKFRFVVTSPDGKEFNSEWFSSNSEWQGRQIEFLWVFESESTFVGSVRFECWTRWGNTDGEVKFIAILLERRASDYRDDVVDYIGGDVVIPTPDPDPEPTPDPDPTPDPPPSGEFDMLEFMMGDGRAYDLRYEFPGGPGEGFQTVQTQVEGRRFYHVKGHIGHQSQWEELFYDHNYIYRGTDISPNMDELYQVHENGEYGQKWIPRIMTIGQQHLAKPLITFRYKSDGRNVPNKDPYIFPHWIKLHAYHPQYTFKSGFTLNDVIELHGFLDAGGSPGVNFERYFYAKGYGLVAWQDPTKQPQWTSYISKVHDSGQLIRMNIGWLELPSLPPLPPKDEPPVKPTTFPLTDSRWKKILLSSTDERFGTNIRQLSNTRSPVIASVYKDRPALILREEARTEPDGIWYPVRLNSRKGAGFEDGDFSNSGWVRQDVVTYREYQEPTPPPPPDEPVDPDMYIEVYAQFDPTNELHSKLAGILRNTGEALDVAGADVSIDEDQVGG